MLLFPKARDALVRCPDALFCRRDDLVRSRDALFRCRDALVCSSQCSCSCLSAPSLSNMSNIAVGLVTQWCDSSWRTQRSASARIPRITSARIHAARMHIRPCLVMAYNRRGSCSGSGSGNFLAICPTLQLESSRSGVTRHSALHAARVRALHATHHSTQHEHYNKTW